MGIVTSRRALTGLALAAAGIAAATAAGDEIFLHGGGRVSGVVVERTETRVVIETGPGRVTLPLARVDRIVEARSALEAFREKAASLAPDDVPGWTALARWADEHELATQSREAWARVLQADPSHPAANAALGRVELDGAWMSEEAAWRARGYVPYEGRWVTPAEHEALVRERAAGEASERERREAELRVREAEARAREAEARAREAESGAQGSTQEGIPLWWGWGGVGPLPPIEPWPPEPPPVVTPPPPSSPPSNWQSVPWTGQAEGSQTKRPR